MLNQSTYNFVQKELDWLQLAISHNVIFLMYNRADPLSKIWNWIGRN